MFLYQIFVKGFSYEQFLEAEKQFNPNREFPLHGVSHTVAESEDGLLCLDGWDDQEVAQAFYQDLFKNMDMNPELMEIKVYKVCEHNFKKQ